MDLAEFLRGNNQIDSVELISFPRLPPQFVVLRGPEARVTCLAIEMKDIEERLELGILQFWDAQKIDTPSASRETFRGGRVISFDYLAAPGFDFISGVRITLDKGRRVITPGAMPYSIFACVGDIQRGDPEYPLDEYRTIKATQ